MYSILVSHIILIRECTDNNSMMIVGHAPYVSKESSTLVTFQKESFSDPPPSPGMEDALEYNCGFTTNSTAQFEINYSTKMYSGGINATVAEGIEAGVEVVDDGVGTVTVTCTGEGKENVVLVICPK